MNIELKEITIQELSDGFEDNNEDGVVGFGGKLDIRRLINVNLFTKTSKEMR
ncbi:MAG: hypothetical protein U0T78_04470 [Cloacibacterium normanense]